MSQAADLTGEVFASALAACGRYRAEHDSGLPWLLGIAHNKLRESRRRGRVEDAARSPAASRPGYLLSIVITSPQVFASAPFTPDDQYTVMPLGVPAGPSIVTVASIVPDSVRRVAWRFRCRPASCGQPVVTVAARNNVAVEQVNSRRACGSADKPGCMPAEARWYGSRGRLVAVYRAGRHVRAIAPPGIVRVTSARPPAG